MNFEQHGVYQVNREGIEEFILGQMVEGISTHVEAGRLTQREALQISASLTGSAAFKQAVNATIQQVLRQMALSDFKEGLREGLKAQ